jgi:hypothetical protein
MPVVMRSPPPRHAKEPPPSLSPSDPCFPSPWLEAEVEEDDDEEEEDVLLRFPSAIALPSWVSQSKEKVLSSSSPEELPDFLEEDAEEVCLR